MPTAMPESDYKHDVAPKTIRRVNLAVPHLITLVSALAGVVDFKTLPARTRISLKELKEVVNGYVPE